MPSLVRNVPQPRLRVKISPLNYRKLVAQGLTVIKALTGNASFPTPSPSLVTLTTDTTSLNALIAQMGTKANKGTAANLIAVKEAARTVASDLTQLLAYVTETVIISSGNDAPKAATLMASSGFPLKSVRSKIDSMQAVQALKVVNTKKFPQAAGYIKWKKPTGLFTGAHASSYLIAIGGVNVGSVTRTRFQLPSIGSNIVVTVTPVSPAGTGLSRSITATRLV